jgi:hypothetical protein
MKKVDARKRVIPTLLATVYTIPALAGCSHEHSRPETLPAEAPRAAVASGAVSQEVIQVLRQGETDRITVNVAGRPGTHFRVYSSATGAEESYAPVPGGEGRVGENGMGAVSFALKELGAEEVHIKVRTSDAADFGDTRVTPKPIVLLVAPVEVKERGLEEKLKGLKYRLQQPSPRGPSAVAGVRG